MAPFHLVRAKARREHFPLIYLRNSNIAPFIFKNYKNMLQRPFIVYADFECSIIPNKDPNKIARHVPNSAMFYFACTYDSSRNKLYTFEGADCVADMIKKYEVSLGIVPKN